MKHVRCVEVQIPNQRNLTQQMELHQCHLFHHQLIRVESDDYPGKFYFLNETTGVAQWERPVELGGKQHTKPKPPISTSSSSPPTTTSDNSSSSSTHEFPSDVIQWVHDSLELSAFQELKLLEKMCGVESEFGISHLSDLKEFHGHDLEQLLLCVPIAKRKKFEKAIQVVKDTNLTL
eukprot:CAMPEP_0114400528 /NCGR_PEP_ID=MMETSP0102-20121206/16481_1 /TAXON_ID=38822 ORGANISM="Pteridomonas danica, Strain PT" /NCGR_SAMPLE_ID=MMETSP0102 /ASSEMBLY_ACC=CAM_ASM_000212 /LENGTH=176 /DNA_ID=CAMNT_0001562983 /DNA_START=1 /DNA_END=531 /DNA_ORIENTATION=+